MRGWIAMALVCLLAGCADGGGPQDGQADEPGVVTDPRDLAASAAGSHVHDYWEGRDQVEVVDADSFGGSVSYGGDHGIVWSAVPPDGSIVPQGTGVIEATLDWTEDEGGPLQPQPFPTAYTRVELWVKTAADVKPHFVHVVEKGVPFRFNSTNEQDDPPHYVVSLWEFSVMLWNEGGTETNFNGQWHFQATAFRTLDLVAFPAHPDVWDGAIEKTLIEATGDVDDTRVVAFQACSGGCLPYVRPANGTTVPFDASSVVVLFEPGAGATPVPVGLRFHGADSRQFQSVPAEAAGSATRFTILVQPSMGDSPYALQSLWEFEVHPGTPQEQGAWKGQYRLTVTALR